MEMSFCNENGIPHSEFLSWDAEDKSKALAYLLEYSETCSMCGTAPWEWEENPHAYMCEEKFCRGCYIKKVSTEGDEDKRLPGTTVTLVPATADRLAEQYLREKTRRARMKREDP